MDFDNFMPLPGINQLVGHTPGRRVREINTARSAFLETRGGRQRNETIRSVANV